MEEGGLGLVLKTAPRALLSGALMTDYVALVHCPCGPCPLARTRESTLRSPIRTTLLLLAGSLLVGCGDPVTPASEDGPDTAPVREWTLENQAYHPLRDISGAAADEMVAIGHGGTILRLVDGEWVDVGPTPLSGVSYGVWSAGPSEFFAVSYAGDYSTAGIHRYRDGEWTTWELDGLCRPMDIWGASPTDVFVVTRCRGGVFHFDGTEWQQLNDHLGLRIHGRRSDDVYMVGYDGVFHYDGTDWSAVDLPDPAADPPFWSVWADPAGDVWLVGGDAEVLRFDGSRWTVVDIGAGPDVVPETVWAAGTDVFVGGYVCPGTECTGIVFHYDGSTWTSAEVTDGVYGISGTGPDDVWAVGLRGRIHHYDGGGWSTVREGRSETLHAVAGSAGTIYAAGPGTVLRHDDDGWNQVLTSTQLSTSPRALWLDGPDDVFVVGGGADPILRYDGVGWAPMSSPVEQLNGVWGASVDDVFAVGPDGAVIRYDGRTWTGMSSGTSSPLNGVWGASADDVLAVGEYPADPDRPGIVRFDGQSWRGEIISHMGHTLEAAWGSGPDDIFAVGLNGLILHWDGERWREHDSGTSADLLAVWGDAPDHVYAVGAAGTVVHYDGTAWSPVSIPFTLGSTLHGVWLDTASDVVIVGEAGAILRGQR